MATTSPIAARFAGPELLERGRTASLRCPLYRDGDVVAASSGTLRIYRPDGTTAAEITVTAETWGASATSPALSSESLGDGWRIEWRLVVGGAAYTFDRMAALCRRRLHPVVSEGDLYRRHSDLPNLKPSGKETYQDYLDDSWEELLHVLRQKGTLPHLILSPEDLRYVHFYLTLQLIFADFAVSQPTNAVWQQTSDNYRRSYRDALQGLTLRYAPDDGATGGARAASPVTFLASGGEGWQDWLWRGQ